MLISMIMPASAEGSAAVDSVIAQLEAIDTLQEMQDNRSLYTADGQYTKATTDEAIINKHLTVRTEYETYLTNMFAARLAAQNAYDSLTEEQKAQISPDLVAKLSNDLPTTFRSESFAVTPRNDEYIFEAVRGNTVGLGYEVSTHMVAETIPQTFIIVDTSDGKTSWTPDVLPYVNGKSNFEVVYCCDYTEALNWGSDYRRVNLEDADFFNSTAAKYIRAITQYSYPYVTLDEMKANLKADGLSESYVDSLTRSDIISAVQMAIWHYSHEGIIDKSEAYFATVSITPNSGVKYFTSLHDFTNEVWEWLPGRTQKTFDAKAGYRVNNLIWHLCNLDPVEAPEGAIVLSDIQVGRTDVVHYKDDIYDLSLHLLLNTGVKEADDVALMIQSYSTADDGSISVTDTVSIKLDERDEYGLSIYAKSGDTVKVTAVGTQYLEKGVYFYEAEGGPTASQSLVGVAGGKTPVNASLEFSFEEDIEKGLRFYKKSNIDQAPISEITFEVYKVEPGEGEILDEVPSESDVAKYAVPENLIGTVTTDKTGYAYLAVESDGTYLVIEKHNTEKVKAPVDPFYVTVPWPTEKEIEGENGTETIIEYEYIVSLYPKNTPNVPPPPPPPPPPEEVDGRFKIVKYDFSNEELLLSGAEFQVYRPATEGDTDIEKLFCDGLQCAVVPMTVNGETIILTTDETGSATSPYLDVGVYYLKELKAPEGYVLRHDIVAVNVVSETVQEIVSVRVGNTHGSQLPETGGIGTVPFIFAGALLMAAAVLTVVIKTVKTALASNSK